jgi:hypothetical protein
MDCDIEDGVEAKTGKVFEHPYDSGGWSYSDIIGVRKDAVYQVTILYAKKWWEQVGGYPTDNPSGMWEDWLFGVLLHIAGVGATYLKGEKWGRYRHWTAGEAGSKNAIDNAGYGAEDEAEREAFQQKVKSVRQWIKDKEASMPCGGCGKTRKTRTANPAMNVPTPQDSDIMVIYEGDREGGFGMNSKVFQGRKIRVQRGVPMVLNAGDRWVADLPGFRLITEEAQGIPVEFPEKPPAPGDLELESEQPKPRFVELGDVPPLVKPEEPQPEPKPIDKVWNEIRKVIGANKLSLIRKAGFDTSAKIREDFEKNGGANIQAVEGIGMTTVRKVRRVVLA